MTPNSTMVYSTMEKTTISLEEAQGLLPKIKGDVLKLMRISKVLSLLKSVHIEYDDPDFALRYKLRRKMKYHKLSYDFYRLKDKLNVLGCIVRDMNKGEVEFHSMFGGREIFLNWQISEKRIKYWREAEESQDSRKPISMITNIQSRRTHANRG